MCWVSKASDIVTKFSLVGLYAKIGFFIDFYLVFQLQIRFDYLDFEMHADGASGGCIYDSMTLLDRYYYLSILFK